MENNNLNDPWIELCSFDRVVAADLAKSFLESHGVECDIHNKHIVSIHWLYSNAVGGAKLMVRESQLDQAAQLLTQARADEFSLPENQVEGLPCPKCSSKNTEMAYNKSRAWSLVSILLFWFPFLFPFLDKENWHCLKCDHEWEQKIERARSVTVFAWLVVILFIPAVYFFWVSVLAVKAFEQF